MSPRHPRRWSCLAAALALTIQGCATSASLSDALADVSDVTELLERQRDAWNRGDIEAFMAEGYWDSEHLVFLSGNDWRWGYDEVLERYRERYLSDGAEMGTLAFDDVQVVPLGPDSSLARGRYHLDFSDGTTADGLFSLILRRMEGGAWRIVQDHTSSAPPDE